MSLGHIFCLLFFHLVDFLCSFVLQNRSGIQYQINTHLIYLFYFGNILICELESEGKIETSGSFLFTHSGNVFHPLVIVF